ncbi:MAG: sulfur carrier protein ThiS [Geobacteraceae bacterium]|nr:sulfur carrier protein ThiS [Geobacteraceae bacterium]
MDNQETLDITTLLTVLKVETPEYVTVELNGEILDRENFDATSVKNGDSIEFLYFRGGGKNR